MLPSLAPTTVERADPRTDAIDRIVRELLPQVAQLTRLVVRRADGNVSRIQAGILSTLTLGPRRITDLAVHEGLAQSTMTMLIKRLEQQGWVERETAHEDGGPVLASITPSGVAALEQFRQRYRSVLRHALANMSPDHVDVLARAIGAVDSLVAAMQREQQG